MISTKSFVMLGLTIGSIVGSYIPVLFGSSELSYISVFMGGVGGIAGIIIGYRLGQDL